MMTLPENKETLHGCFETVELMLDLRLVDPVKMSNELNDTRGVIRGGTGFRQALELS